MFCDLFSMVRQNSKISMIMATKAFVITVCAWSLSRHEHDHEHIYEFEYGHELERSQGLRHISDNFHGIFRVRNR